MDSVISPIETKKPALRSHVRAADLAAVLNEIDSKVKTLSLDCFDTILWRKTATPIDNFFDLQERPAFKKLGFGARMRAQAEGLARQDRYLNESISEVKLPHIYKALFRKLSDEQVSALEKDELDSEMEACYAFPPAIALMRAAADRGLRIIIVSDTYLSEAQLRYLLEQKLPADVFAAIDKVYCSCEKEKSKSEGLFPIILEELNELPSAILHVGDHIIADYVTPEALGFHAIQLIHHDKHVGESLRMQALAAGFIDPYIRFKRPLMSPFRGLLATRELSPKQTESTLGYTSLGQIMYAFVQFIFNEVELLKQQGKQPKILFIMRDGYLPALACEAYAGKPVGHCVRISRYVAHAASFRSKDDIDRYLGENVLSFRFFDICKQLLLPEKITNYVIEKALKGRNPIQEFINLIHTPEILDEIITASKNYYQRLKKYLEKEIDLQPNDTLMFVDLGYTGTAQVKLEPIFREDMNVSILGRYLIALRTPSWETTRKGLLDPSWCDDRAMQMLVAYIALLEQLCTAAEKSVIDYDEAGNPIFSETCVSATQHEKLALIQAECIRFIKDAKHFFSHANTHLPLTILRDTALAEMARLLFLPTEAELDYLKSFEFDLNLGTKDLLDVVDTEKGLTGLRRRGLFFMEKNLKTMRTNYPAELRSAGLELVLTLMAHHRFEFDIRVNDLSLRRESIRVIAIRGGQSTQHQVEALPTHDGYFSLIIPIGHGEFQIGVQFGLAYQWIQLDSAEIIDTSTLYGSKESENTEDASANLVLDQMDDKGQGLYKCLSKSGLLVYVPTLRNNQQHYALRIIFRPITKWVEESEIMVNN